MYERTDSDTDSYQDMWEVGAALGFDKKETERITQYLVDEGLLEYPTMGGTIAITHFGVIQIEEALAAPEEPTHYFPPINIVNVGTMTGSTIQQAGSVRSQSVITSGSELNELKEFVKSLEEILQDLGDEGSETEDLKAQIETLRAQLTAPNPNRSILFHALSSVANIFEGMMGSILASQLLPQVQIWLSRLS